MFVLFFFNCRLKIKTKLFKFYLNMLGFIIININKIDQSLTSWAAAEDF